MDFRGLSMNAGMVLEVQKEGNIMRKPTGNVVRIVEKDTAYTVNGIEVPHDFLKSLFAFVGVPADEECQEVRYQRLLAYLCLVPIVYDRVDHMVKYHKLSDEAKVALALAPAIYQAVGLNPGNDRAFVTACMAQLDIEYNHVGAMGHYIFGDCGAEEEEDGFSYEGNVIPFPSHAVN
jgi:hypothetical protein